MNDKQQLAENQRIYEDRGYANRKEYLQGLAEEYGTDYRTVAVLAGVLGPSEDFDGLVSELEDYTMINW